MSGISANERDELFDEEITLTNRFNQEEEKNAMLYFINETYYNMMMEDATWEVDEESNTGEAATTTPTTLTEVETSLAGWQALYATIRADTQAQGEPENEMQLSGGFFSEERV